MNKQPYSKITAIDMNTGEHAWEIPIGQASEQLRNHPALRGVDLSNVGGRSRAIMMVTRSLLFASEGSGGRPILNAVNKRTGQIVGTIDLPAPSQYGMMTYMHEGKQYLVAQIARGGSFPGSLVALVLPE